MKSEPDAESVLVVITLSMPPSANRMYRRAGAHMIKSDEYRRWSDAAMLAVAAQTCERLAWFGIGITLPPTRRDPDNSIKPLIDALQAGGAIVNDRMLRRLVLSVDDDRSEEDGALITLWPTNAPIKKPKNKRLK